MYATLKNCLILCVTLFITGCQSLPARPDLVGDVITLKDSDSMVMLNPESQVMTVHLADVKAPQHNEPFAVEARNALFDLVFDKTVQVQIKEKQGEDNFSGYVFLEGQPVSVNALLVQQGLAQVTVDTGELHKLEQQAREQRLGIWSIIP